MQQAIEVSQKILSGTGTNEEKLKEACKQSGLDEEKVKETLNSLGIKL